MKPMTMYTAQVAGRSSNATYPNQHHVTTATDLEAVARLDHVVATYAQGRRSAGSFITADCVVMDIDNSHTDDPQDWVTPESLADVVPGVKKRPIYWLFSSPKGSFNALIYMHRYTSSTVSTVLNEYLREFDSKLEANLQHQERVAARDSTPRVKAAALKEAERLRKILLELSEYEHDVLYPLASQQVAIDLDDGVKVNYPKFYPALKKISGLEEAGD